MRCLLFFDWYIFSLGREAHRSLAGGVISLKILIFLVVLPLKFDLYLKEVLHFFRDRFCRAV